MKETKEQKEERKNKEAIKGIEDKINLLIQQRTELNFKINTMMEAIKVLKDEH